MAPSLRQGSFLLSCSQETRNSLVAAEAKEILICGGMNFETKKVFVNKLDASLSSLKECQ